MAGSGSSDRAAAAAPNLPIGAAPGASSPPVSAPPAPATVAGSFHSMAGRESVHRGGIYALVAASQRRKYGNSGSNGTGPARGGVPSSPPVQQPVVFQPVAPAAPAAAAMDCTAAALYCFICDNTDHTMSQCPVLKLPRPSAMLCGHGSGTSSFLQIPDSVWRADLALPTAVVTVTEGKPTASVVEDIIRSIVPLPGSWRWEALPHGDNAFLVSFPSPEDLRRVTNYQVRLKSLGVALDFTEWKGVEAPSSSDLHVVWVHVKGVPYSVRHFWGLWAVGSVVGSTQDVDLLCLRRRGIVRVQVAVLGNEVFPLETVVVVKNKGYMLQYSPDGDFVPKVWDHGRKDENHGNGSRKRVKNEI